MVTKQNLEPHTLPDGEGRAASPIQRALRAIELLAVEPLTAAELARELDVNRSTALRLLGELVATGYVARSPATKRYATVAAKFYGLIQAPEADWSQIVDPVLASIRDECGDATILAVPAKDTMVYLGFFPTRHMVAVSEQLGTIRPMHCSALGKAYLSALDDDALDAQLARLSYVGGTEHAAKGPIELRRRVEEAREVGYAVDRDETFEGVRCVAVPARIRGTLIGAAGISGPSSRLPDSRVDELGRYLISCMSGL
ncbi:IclR family transcriptional regulator [Nonomuraea terrae]|uniref:IclR family transcriptional regulator n=1 Tax=Nonomuraea terrae TaxID=2530383 RepID=UPI00378FEF24